MNSSVLSSRFVRLAPTGLAALVPLFCAGGLNAQDGRFEPWDRTKWSDHYNAAGAIIKEFDLDQSVVFPTRNSAWNPKLATRTLFRIVRPGIEVVGNGVIIDARPASSRVSLSDQYRQGARFRSSRADCFVVDRMDETNGPPTVIRGFTIRGFDLGIVNYSDHPTVIEYDTLSNNRWGNYVHSPNQTLSDDVIVENILGGVYCGSTSYDDLFVGNTFRDNGTTQRQASYGDIAADCINHSVFEGNAFGPSRLGRAYVTRGISFYRNSGERNRIRTELPHDDIVRNNTFDGYTAAIQLGARMGVKVRYDLSGEGRDYAFHNTVEYNAFTDCTVGIKVNTEGNTIQGNRFVDVMKPIVLDCVYFHLRDTTIDDEPGTDVYLWYENSDWAQYARIFPMQAELNQGIFRNEKRIEVYSREGVPRFVLPPGANDFRLNPAPPAGTGAFADRRVGAPISLAFGNFFGGEKGLDKARDAVAVYARPISRVGGVDYYSIVITDLNGIEINRCGRSRVKWRQVAAGHFLSAGGEDSIAAVHADAIDGKYPVYIFTRGRKDPQEILEGGNTDPSIQLGTDPEGKLSVTFGDAKARAR